MGGLSTFFKPRDPAAAIVRPVEAGEIEPALRLLLGSGGHTADGVMAAHFEHVSQLRGIDLTAMQVAILNRSLLAATLIVDSPGHTALLMLSTAGNSASTAECIARCATASVSRLSDHQPLLVQALLEASENAAATALTRVGFERLATLIYLQRNSDRPLTIPEPPPGINVIRYSLAAHGLFCEAIEASYQNSLDCPPLHGKRSTDDVIEGHKATGDFHPALWFCLIEKERPIGLLLLAPVSGHGTMELVYLGLAPAARGRQLGDYLMKRAIAETYAAGYQELSLAVDSLNVPALKLYYRHGMTELHRREALMLTLPQRKP